MDHLQARAVLIEAFAARGLSPGLTAVQAVQAIGKLESNYGGQSNNWGSVQCGSKPPCPSDCMELTDKTAAGTGYSWCYRRYASPVEGAADFIRELFRRPGVPEALASGSALAATTAMRAQKYMELAADEYARRMVKWTPEIAKALAEPLLVTFDQPTAQPVKYFPAPTKQDLGMLALAAFGAAAYFGAAWLATRKGR